MIQTHKLMFNQRKEIVYISKRGHLCLEVNEGRALRVEQREGTVYISKRGHLCIEVNEGKGKASLTKGGHCVYTKERSLRVKQREVGHSELNKGRKLCTYQVDGSMVAVSLFVCLPPLFTYLSPLCLLRLAVIEANHENRMPNWY